MNQTKRFLELLGQKKTKFHVLIAAIIAFWYIALFPGRLGADYSGLIRIIQLHKSSDWFTSTFYWYYRITSFDGRAIFLSSFIGIILLSFALYFFLFSLPGSRKSLEKTYLVMLATPFFGVFGVTVSHDVFQVVGLLILIGLEIRIFRKQKIMNFNFLLILIAACLMTTHTGIVFIALYACLLTIRRKFRQAVILLFVTIFLFFGTSINIDSTFVKGARFYYFISDLKCIAQHPEARITAPEWQYLESISNYSEWKYPITCSSVQYTGEFLKVKPGMEKVTKSLLINYIHIATRNPAIFIMSHIQKSRGALPPPFFQGPENQVSLDISKPIGFGTNIALQSGPELLHPSIDEPSVKIRIPFLKPLEFIAQIPTFLVNQASWFWGWGGFWLWPICIYWIMKLRVRKMKDFIVTLHPLVVLHLSLVILVPGAVGRYYMATILIGLTVTILSFIEYLQKPDRIKAY